VRKSRNPYSWIDRTGGGAARRGILWTWLLSAGLAGLCCQASRGQSAAPAAPDDLVIATLNEVRDTRADLFVPHSSVLGDLPGPAALAAAQPQFREMFASKPPYAIEFTARQTEELARKYEHYSFAGSPRSAGLTSLGVTGAYIQSLDTRGELFVVAVVPGTPAEGKLQVNDVIIGANGRLFRQRRDPRIPMGCALYESTTEKLGGKLTLQLLRAGKAMNVVLDLPVLPPYSDTWPYDCRRSKRIADDMLHLVLGYDTSTGRGLWSSLFLMASGDGAALDLARRMIYRSVKDEYPREKTGRTWGCAYNLVNLTEYYLLTGDSKVLGAIDHNRAVLQAGQSRAGGWGHGCPCGGYGEVNCAGLVALNGLALARECGMKMDKRALAQSIRYHARFIGAGVPYGDHNSGLRAGASNNGKSGMGTLAYKFFGLPDTDMRWGRAVAYMYLQPEAGHAEGIFNLAWDPLAAAIAPREESAVHMNNPLWYYELARTHEGGLRFFRGGHFGYPVGQTTALGLVYMLPRKKIYLTGAPKSVFAMTPPNAALADAAMYYRRKNWASLKAVLSKYLADASNEHQDYARKLMDAYERMEANAALTIKLAEANIGKREFYRARQQLVTLRHVLGQWRPQITELLKKVPGQPIRPRQKPTLAVEPKGTIFAVPPEKPSMYEWQILLPLAEASKRTNEGKCQVYKPRKPGDKPAGAWFDADYKTTGWEQTRGRQTLRPGREIWIRRTFKPYGSLKTFAQLMLMAKDCQGELYLNGYKLADFTAGEFYLGSAALTAMKEGANVLSARIENPQDKTVAADLGLKNATLLRFPDLKEPIFGL